MRRRNRQEVECGELLRCAHCDLLDVLEYAAFEIPMQKRVQRAMVAKYGLSEWVKSDSHLAFYSFVLDNYVQEGVDVFNRDNALSSLLVTKYQTIQDAKNELGEIADIKDGFAALQKKVYAK